MSRRRWERGSIDFDLPEAEVVVDEFGEPTAVVPYERHIAHRIIEHFMISANETVARHLETLGYPCLYRVHEPPDPERVEELLLEDPRERGIQGKEAEGVHAQVLPEDNRGL
ncbi:MAG: RNB domain-containing ribonuclease [Aquificota bacterium]|nr:RNB domain-containing ribonuclease [Aquificota bacterium]